jgi:hypothetical protein
MTKDIDEVLSLDINAINRIGALSFNSYKASSINSKVPLSS